MLKQLMRNHVESLAKILMKHLNAQTITCIGTGKDKVSAHVSVNDFSGAAMFNGDNIDHFLGLYQKNFLDYHPEESFIQEMADMSAGQKPKTYCTPENGLRVEIFDEDTGMRIDISAYYIDCLGTRIDSGERINILCDYDASPEKLSSEISAALENVFPKMAFKFPLKTTWDTNQYILLPASYIGNNAICAMTVILNNNTPFLNITSYNHMPLKDGESFFLVSGKSGQDVSAVLYLPVEVAESGSVFLERKLIGTSEENFMSLKQDMEIACLEIGNNYKYPIFNNFMEAEADWIKRKNRQVSTSYSC